MEGYKPTSTGILQSIPQSKKLGRMMKKIQYVSTYIALAQEGLVSKLECPIDQGLLLCNQTDDENIFLYCLSCRYIRTIGIKLYEQIVDAVELSQREKGV